MSQPSSLPRLAIVLSRPTPEHDSWFRWLHAAGALSFRVFYLIEPHESRARSPGEPIAYSPKGYDWEWIENRARDPSELRFFGLRNPTLRARIEDWGAQAILVFDYAQLTHVQLILWARRRGLPVIFASHSRLSSDAKGPQRLLRAWILRHVSACLTDNDYKRTQLLAQGIPSERIFAAPRPIHREHFDPTLPVHQTIALALRVELGLAADTRVMLYHGPLTRESRVGQLLEVFIDLARTDAALVICGEGPEKPELLARAARASDTLQLQFLPAPQYTEIPSRYLFADVVVLTASSAHAERTARNVAHLGRPLLVSDDIRIDFATVSTVWCFRAGDSDDLQKQLLHAIDNARSVSISPTPDTHARAAESLFAALRAATGKSKD